MLEASPLNAVEALRSDAGAEVGLLERVMFYWFLGAVGVVVALTLLGAMISRRAPGTAWEANEDRPLGPGLDH